LSCSASIWLSPSTHTYRLFCFFKERCRSLRFVSVAALSAEEANYTAPTYPRQHFVRENCTFWQKPDDQPAKSLNGNTL
jgi:hypothetical protein